MKIPSDNTCSCLLGELETYKAAVDTSMSGFCSVGRDGRILDVNRSFCRITGYSRDELLKMGISELEAKESPREVLRHIEKILKEGGDRFESKFRRKDGEIIDIEVLSVILLPDKKDRFFSFMQDITRRKEAERYKDEFVSLASHQLQSPLIAVRWCIERMVAGKEGELAPKHKELLLNVLYSIKEISKLVSDLLSVSRIEGGRLEIKPEPVDLRNLIGEIVKEQDTLIAKKAGKVILEIPEEFSKINLDPGLIREILRNFIINAINYSLPGKCEIKIKLGKTEKEYIFSVADKGIGIPREVQCRIFEKFFRANNAQKNKPKGTGLGLYLVKRIAEAANCKIYFDSVENEGTIFYFSIPLGGMRRVINKANK